MHLLSAFDTSTATVLAYVQVAVKSNEIPAFTPLLDLVAAQLGSLEGIVFVADACTPRPLTPATSPPAAHT